MKIDASELDELDRACALKIMKWRTFEKGNVSTYEPVGISMDAFRPTRWVLDAFKLVDALVGVSFSLVRNDDGSFTATFSDRNTAHKATKPTPAYAITVAAIHYSTDVRDIRRGPIGPELKKMR